METERKGGPVKGNVAIISRWSKKAFVRDADNRVSHQSHHCSPNPEGSASGTVSAPTCIPCRIPRKTHTSSGKDPDKRSVAILRSIRSGVMFWPPIIILFGFSVAPFELCKIIFWPFAPALLWTLSHCFPSILIPSRLSLPLNLPTLQPLSTQKTQTPSSTRFVRSVDVPILPYALEAHLFLYPS
ncbi:hypothetical protein CPB85DRAFT_88786 [Mucidula mucida]|nr:hypothetical protein CPB85DRAFT_88786 [Mucidula mucida]